MSRRPSFSSFPNHQLRNLTSKLKKRAPNTLTTNLTYLTIFRVIEALNCATMSMLAFATYFPEYVRARLSAALIFGMLEQRPRIRREPSKLPETQLHFDEWQLKAVDFAYPANPRRRVLHRMQLDVKRGQTLALVGASGCGKSTVIQLLERFYDPSAGEIVS